MYAATGANLEMNSQDQDQYDPQFFAWEGRIGRLRYLAYHTLALFVVYFVGGMLSAVLIGASSSVPSGVAAAPLLMFLVSAVPSITFAKRRLNDMGDSGWLSILSLIPLINIFFGLYLAFAPGIDGRNQYGPAPSKNSTLVVLCGLILPVVMFIGIVAAIALPAYKEYTVRVKAAQAHEQSQAASPQN